MDTVPASPVQSVYEKARDELRRSFAPAERLLNRELSWLDFNGRVLEEALDPGVPALERLKFLAIFASNLDEFFMVRVAFVRRQIEAGITKQGRDGLRPQEVLEKIVERVNTAHENIGLCYRDHILPALMAHGVRIVTDNDATMEQRAFAAEYFKTTLHGLVTPLALDAAHPFPQLENGALYFSIELTRTHPVKEEAGTRLVLLRLPTNAVGRFVRLPAPDGSVAVMMIDDVIRLSLNELFPGEDVLGCFELKIVRDSDLDIDEVGSVDLLKSIVQGLQRRKRGPATRFLYDPAMPRHILNRFARQLNLSEQHMFPGARYHSFSDMMQIPALVNRPDLMYPPMPPLSVRVLESGPSMFDVLCERDILLHHPHQSCSYVARFREEAASDPATVTVKATLYRVSSDSRVAAALARAARNGKQVTVLIELKARFDEERNINWARALEEAGVHVVYGVKGLKTHCKTALVVRKEGRSLRRYCHLSTGNYNDRTARVYDDIGLLTAHEGITEDVAMVFHRLTGEAPVKGFTHLLVAPEHLRREFTDRIRREADYARAGRPAGITAKMNSLVDPDMIDELYAAARTGVPIRLIVRGICCLKPGVPGLSENIEVVSIVDRFLEHARIYRFVNGGNAEVFLSSADWMPRNLNNRIEVAFPIVSAELRSKVEKILDLQLSDNVKVRVMQPDGSNTRRRGVPPVRAQFAAYDLAAEESG